MKHLLNGCRRELNTKTISTPHSAWDARTPTTPDCLRYSDPVVCGLPWHVFALPRPPRLGKNGLNINSQSAHWDSLNSSPYCFPPILDCCTVILPLSSSRLWTEKQVLNQASNSQKKNPGLTFSSLRHCPSVAGSCSPCPGTQYTGLCCVGDLLSQFLQEEYNLNTVAKITILMPGSIKNSISNSAFPSDTRAWGKRNNQESWTCFFF